jgi:putative aldouronate transport system substrate-binding protein
MMSCQGASIAPTSSHSTVTSSSVGERAATITVSFPLKDTTTLKVAVAKYGPHGPFEDMAVVRDWEAKTNIHVDWNVIPVENRNEKLQLMFATGDLPDVFFGLLSNSDTINYGAQGLIIPLEELIDKHMPNLRAIFEKRPQLKAALTASAGHIYSFPRVDETEAEEVLSKAYINVDWLNKLNLKMPTTTDEFYEVLKAFKEGDPNGNGKMDEIPFTALGSWGPEFSFGLYPMYHAFGAPDMPEHVAVNDGKVVYAPTLPEYKDAIRYWNKLYKEGLADVELFTQSFAQMTAKGRSPESVYGSFVSYLDTVTVGEDRDDVYEVLPPMKGPNGHQGWPRLSGRMFSLNAAQISKANKQPELTAAWIDRFYEPKQSAANLWGAVGEVLNEDSQGMLRFNQAPSGINWAEFRHHSTPGGVAPSAILKEHWNTVVEFPQEKRKVTEDIQAFLPYLTQENFPFVFLFSKEEERELTKLRTAIETNVEQMTAKWITASPPSDSEWRDYLESMKRMGLDQLLAIYQGAYDRYRKVAQ